MQNGNDKRLYNIRSNIHVSQHVTECGFCGWVKPDRRAVRSLLRSHTDNSEHDVLLLELGYISSTMPKPRGQSMAPRKQGRCRVLQLYRVHRTQRAARRPPIRVWSEFEYIFKCGRTRGLTQRSATRYRVDEGPNAARKRARGTMAPLNNKTQTSTYPLIPHREFPTVVTD
jgi:hypothetical protein